MTRLDVEPAPLRWICQRLRVLVNPRVSAPTRPVRQIGVFSRMIFANRWPRGDHRLGASVRKSLPVPGRCPNGNRLPLPKKTPGASPTGGLGAQSASRLEVALGAGCPVGVARPQATPARSTGQVGEPNRQRQRHRRKLVGARLTAHLTTRPQLQRRIASVPFGSVNCPFVGCPLPRNLHKHEITHRYRTEEHPYGHRHFANRTK